MSVKAKLGLAVAVILAAIGVTLGANGMGWPSTQPPAACAGCHNIGDLGER